MAPRQNRAAEILAAARRRNRQRRWERRQTFHPSENAWRAANFRRELIEHLRWAEDQLQDAGVPPTAWQKFQHVIPSDIGGPGLAADSGILTDYIIAARGLASESALAWRIEKLAVIAFAAHQALGRNEAFQIITCRAIDSERRAIERMVRVKAASQPRKLATPMAKAIRTTVAAIRRRGEDPSSNAVMYELQRTHEGTITAGAYEITVDGYTITKKTLQNRLRLIVSNAKNDK